jgi:DNA invertase Pin-like site-specific DNA recombinase
MASRKVVAYCRVSTDSKDQENSFENQKSYFQREIKINANYEYCGIYADKGITGTTLIKRPDFNRMLKDAGLKDPENEDYSVVAKPEFDIIVTKNTSRFARNVSVDVILKALARNKVYVSFLDINKTTENTDDISFIQFFLTFDERDSRDKSKKTTFGMEEGAKKGIILVNNKIHGYTYIQSENRLVQDEYAPNIKRMFEMYADGIGAHTIALTLKKEGIVSKSNKHYSEHTIRGILSNEKYYGMVVRMKYDTGTVFNKHTSLVIRPEEKQIRFMSEKIDPIINKELFDKVQVIRTSKTQSVKQKDKKRGDIIDVEKGIHYGTSPYARKIFCAVCGRQYRSTTTKYYGAEARKERYYRCVGKLDETYNDPKPIPEKKCKNPNVTQTYLDNELKSEKYTEMLAASFIVAQRFLVELKYDIQITLHDKNVNEKLVQLKTEQKECEATIDKMMELYKRNIADLESVEKSLVDTRAKNREVTATIEELEKPKHIKMMDLKNIDESMEELQRRLFEIYDFDEMYNEDNYTGSHGIYNVDYSKPPKKKFTRDEILKDINRITVTSSKNLIIKFKKFAEVEKLVDRHKHIMTKRTEEIFEELKASGWNMAHGWEIMVSEYDRTHKF